MNGRGLGLTSFKKGIMRVYDETTAPSGKKRILFACGIEDIQILAGLVAKAKLYTPKVQVVEEAIDLHHRLSSMSKEFGKYLNQRESKPKYGKTNPCPLCERTLRGEKALAMHIEKVHSNETNND